MPESGIFGAKGTKIGIIMSSKRSLSVHSMKYCTGFGIDFNDLIKEYTLNQINAIGLNSRDKRCFGQAIWGIV